MACCDIQFTLEFTTECFRESAKHYIVVNFVHQETRRRDYFLVDGITPSVGTDFIAIRVRRPDVSSSLLSHFKISKQINNGFPVTGLIKRIPANYYTEMPNKLRFEVIPNCALSSFQMGQADAFFAPPDATDILADGTIIEYKFFAGFLSALGLLGEGTTPISAIDMPIVTSSDVGPMVAEIQKMYGSNAPDNSSGSFQYKPMQYLQDSSGICRCSASNVTINFPHHVPDGMSLSLCTNDINQLKGFRLVEGPYNYGSFSNTRRKACSDCTRFELSSFWIPSLTNTPPYTDIAYLFFQPCADTVMSLSSDFEFITGVRVQKVESSIINASPLPYSETFKAYRPVSLRFVPAVANVDSVAFRLNSVFSGTYTSFLLGSMAIWIVRIDSTNNKITYLPYSETISYNYDPITAAPYASVLTPNGL